MGPRRGATLVHRVATAQRRTQAIRLRMAGKTWARIAAELGYCGKGAACQDVQRALDAHNAERHRREAEAREFRRQVARWLRPQWRALVPRLAAVDPLELLFASGEPREVLRAIGTLERILAELVEVGSLTWTTAATSWEVGVDRRPHEGDFLEPVPAAG
jgi:hypothetical protein